MARAMKCDKCGVLSEESGAHERSTRQTPYPTWARERVKDVIITVNVEVSGSYGPEIEPVACDLCKKCFLEVVTQAITNLVKKED